MVSCEMKDGSGLVDALTFVTPEVGKFVYPCFALLNSIASTDAVYYKDDEGEAGFQTFVQIPIINAETRVEEGVE